jgi:CRISPR-associated endonuclease Csn1
MPTYLGFDIGSNSVGSAWVDTDTGEITTGISIFPAGVDESDEKRGDPKNAKRRMTRRTRITLRRRAQRKRELRLKLIEAGLLPRSENEFKELLETTEPWELRRKGLDERLRPHEFGRVLLHLAQRRGAMGVEADLESRGKVKAAMIRVQREMLNRYGSESMKADAAQLQSQIDALNRKKNRTDEETEKLDQAYDRLTKLLQSLLRDRRVTFGRFMADQREELITPITATIDRRKVKKGSREFRGAIRNKGGNYRYCADRGMIRDEFAKLWESQRKFGGELAGLLTNGLRNELDNESRDETWRHQGLLFGQRAPSWDLGTLGRCVLEPTDRCVAHADMYASRYLVLESVNNLRVVEDGIYERPLTMNERATVLGYLSGPLGKHTKGPHKGKPKRKPTISDVREVLGWSNASRYRFKQEDRDEQREINTDWFCREIIHGVIGQERWDSLANEVREKINRWILRFDPLEGGEADRLKAAVSRAWPGANGAQLWPGLDENESEALIAAWKRRPKPEASRLNMSRRAVCSLLPYMEKAFTNSDRRPNEPPQLYWIGQDDFDPARHRWLTQIEARKAHAEAIRYRIAASIVEREGVSIDDAIERASNDVRYRRYATGAKGATARDRYYVRQVKHWLKDEHGTVVRDANGNPIPEPPPAPTIANPVARKAVHEVRRHLIDYLKQFGRRPDFVHVELWRQAAMGKVDADRQLFINRLASRIRKEIIEVEEFALRDKTKTQQSAAVERVVLSVQQGYRCPLCGQDGLTPRKAAYREECEVAHIFPKGSGGHNGLTNVVLAHEECNRKMRKRTPRDFWESTLPGGFEEGMGIVERIYRKIDRIQPSEVKAIHGEELWKCYLAKPARKYFMTPRIGGDFFTNLTELAKIEQFKKEKPDPDMTARQEAATKYAARQVMAYLSDALYHGGGLPERSGKQQISPVTGQWTKRLRDEWELYWQKPSAGSAVRKECNSGEAAKDRDDHHHHAIDALVVACCTLDLRNDWERREKMADAAGINTADEEQMASYRRSNRLPIPAPFGSQKEFKQAVYRAVFERNGSERAICHRPIKRKLIGALHKETLFGPTFDSWVQGGIVNRRLRPNRFTVRQDVLGDTPQDFLKPSHLREKREETDTEAVERLARRLRIGKYGLSDQEAVKRARAVVKGGSFTRKLIDPSPDKGGIVRDNGLRRLIRRRLVERGLNPDSYTRAELNRSIKEHGPITMFDGGPPIHRVVLLWANRDAVVIQRDKYDYSTGRRSKSDDPAALRVYDGQNNHHIEIRQDQNGDLIPTVISAKIAGERLLARVRKLSALERPYLCLRGPLTVDERRKLTREARIALAKQRRREWKGRMAELKPLRSAVIAEHPIVDRCDNELGSFVMSLCEGEMIKMLEKSSRNVGYFVVAEIEKAKKRVILVPHWDARRATERKDADGKKIPESKRREFAATMSDLKDLAPPGKPHAVKVRVSPLGRITELEKD